MTSTGGGSAAVREPPRPSRRREPGDTKGASFQKGTVAVTEGGN